LPGSWHYYQYGEEMILIREILKPVGWPTQTVTIDFETYFDKDYTLSKLSLIEYVRDERFDFTGVGCQINDSRPATFTPKPLKAVIKFLQREYGKNLEKVTVIIQNAKFDALILKEKFGINPPYIVDIKDLARHIDARMSHSLKDLAKMYGLKPKGDTNQFKGLHYEDMDTDTKADLAAYCNNDVEITHDLLQALLLQISTPEIELPIARHTLKLFLEPILELNAKKASALRQRMEMQAHIAAWSTGYTQKEIRGNLSFVGLLLDALLDYGITTDGTEDISIPMKPGKPGKNMTKLLGIPGMIPAFAKDDVEFQKLLIHPDKTVRELCRARQAVKSWPLHIKRLTRLINQSKAWNGKLGVDLNYYGGHLGRWSGGGGVNLQNLGGRGRMVPLHPLIGEIKTCIHAPDGYVIPNADSAQVEARLLAWIAGQDDLVTAFADNKDIYSEFATTLFREKVWKPNEKELKTPEGRLAKIHRGFGKDAILGCGFGMGKDTFYERCLANPELRPYFDSGDYNLQFIGRLISTYRSTYSRIPEFWSSVEKAFRWVVKYPHESISVGKLTFWNDEGVVHLKLPSGRQLLYPGCFIAKAGKYDTLHWKYGHLWGGTITENIIQATAADLLRYWILKAEESELRVVHHIHDSIYCMAEEKYGDTSLDTLMNIMKCKPAWAEGLPLGVEGKISKEL